MAKIAKQPYQMAEAGKSAIFFNNLIGGIAWGLGATVGVSIFFTVLGFIASQVGVVPVVGSFVSEIIDFVMQHNQNFQK
jgi:hypothetical protein